MTEPENRPRFTIVSAVYGVEPYLPAFIDSVENQRIPPQDLEIVAVDDGSTDGSLELLVGWAQRSRFRVKVFTKPNGGQASARNLGLEHATGEWVTFADPDDRLHRDYLLRIDRFERRTPGLEIMAGKPILHLEAEGRLRDKHPRRRQYAPGNRVVDMADEPNVFPGSTNVGFYRLDRIRAASLRFDPRVRPNFEDGQFAVHYLLALERQVVGLVADAQYLYRKRADQSSTLQRSLLDPRRYTTVLELGYLEVIERAKALHGSVPPWLQHVLIYELYWYLAEDLKISSGAYLEPGLVPRFHELLGRVLVELDPDVVAAHRVLRLTPLLRDVFARAARPGPWHSPFVVRTRTDNPMHLRRIEYRFVGRAPREEISIGGRPADVAFARTMSHPFYGRNLVSERILWVAGAGDLDVRLDGVPVSVLARWPRFRAGEGRRGRVTRWRRRWGRRLSRWRRQPTALVLRGLARRAGRAGGRVVLPLVHALAASPYFRNRFRGAWLLMDRIHDADDNGERLFEYLRAARPDINAWFVLERGTADWKRLVASGEERLIAHGSLTWKVAMLNCSWLLSSHADRPIYRPPELAGTGHAGWRFAFLQHGIIKDDLSVWLNARELDLFVVSTEAELASVVGENTAYRFTAKETRNTGLPRFDRLLEKGRAVPTSERDLVIVAPTWRQWLAQPLHAASQRRALDVAFWESDYIRNWTALLRSPRVAAALATRGWQLGFMPHPNLQSMLGQLDLPAHVRPLTFEGTDVQGLYARCALLVTDYSSVAFNTAYLDRPVVYFQFDRERMLGGAHVGRRGYFDYERDGFGPVVDDLDAAERAVVASIERGPLAEPLYQARIDATFPIRDGGACARVVAAVEALSRPWEPVA